MSRESWHLMDRTTGRTLGSRASGSLHDAARKRVHLLKLAYEISRECGDDATRRCDIRQSTERQG